MQFEALVIAVEIEPLRAVTETTISTVINPTSKAYSAAEAPSSSLTNRRMAFNMVCTFLLCHVNGYVFRNILHIPRIRLSSATDTPIGNSLTSFTRVVASESRFRIASRTLQSSGQPA